MNGPILIFLLIVVISLVIGAVSQVLKAAQQAAPPARGRPRPVAARPASGDIDRFLEEIDRLRKKKAEGGADRAEPPVARPVARPAKVPVAKPIPVAKRRRPDAVPTAVKSPPALPPRLADAPAAPVADPYQRSEVTAQPRLAALPKATGGPGASVSPGQRRQTKFARDLAALLASPQAVPMAVVLTEILGPPKCRKS